MKKKLNLFSKKNTFFCLFVIIASVVGGLLFNLPRIRALSSDNPAEETKQGSIDWDERLSSLEDKPLDLTNKDHFAAAEERDRRRREEYYTTKFRSMPISDSERRQHYREVVEEVRNMKRDLRRMEKITKTNSRSVTAELKRRIQAYESDVAR